VVISDANPVQFWLIDCDTYNERETCGVHYKCFCQPIHCNDEITIQFTEVESVTPSLVIQDSEDDQIGDLIIFDETLLDTGLYLYEVTFILSNLEICDQVIQFKIFYDSDSAFHAKTDCLDVKSEHECTQLITYSNNRNVFGIYYEDRSPEVEFNLRIPAIFFHERFPEEDNISELSDSRIITTSSVIRAQRLLDTDYMPDYMHRKIMLALKHQFVTIGSQQWTKQEPYEKIEGDRRWPVKKAKCYLNERTFVQRNVI
jgi:hypothetical protein